MNMTIASGVAHTEAEIRGSKIFGDWAKGLPVDSEWSVNILDIGWGGAIHMITMEVVHDGSPYPVKVILRSATVDVLTRVVSPRSDDIVLVRQLREAVPGMVISNVAGGIDGDEDPLDAARREVFEEVGLEDVSEEDYTLEVDYLVNGALLASPGLINEGVYFVQATIRVSADKADGFVARLQNKRTGVAAEGESIALTVIPTACAKQFVLDQEHPCAKTYLSLSAANL